MDKGKMLWTILGFGIALSVVAAGAYFINIDGQSEEEDEEHVQPKGGIYLMMIEGVDGELKDPDHAGWMILDSFTFPTISTKASASGSTRIAGEVTYEPLRIVKRIDKASPKLMDKCLKATVIPNVVVKYCRMTEDGSLVTIMVYEFKNVVINGFHGGSESDSKPTEEVQTGGAGGDDSPIPTYQPFFDVGKNWVQDRPMEGMVMDFQELKVTYTEFDADFKAKGNVEATWKVGS